MIDKDVINRIALDMITEELETVYDVADLPDIQKVLLGQLYGITQMAKAMKEELKGE